MTPAFGTFSVPYLAPWDTFQGVKYRIWQGYFSAPYFEFENDVWTTTVTIDLYYKGTDIGQTQLNSATALGGITTAKGSIAPGSSVVIVVTRG